MALNRKQLTLIQEQKIAEIERFYKSGKDIITIAGPAGSSKTSIIKFVIDDLELRNSTAYVAFTGKAASVLRRKGLPATTIHRLIYDVKFGRGFVYFLKKDFLPLNIRLIVVDEISMVGEKLLKDLLSFGIQIIALGDSYQLEPVKDATNGLLESPDIILTEQFRQSEDCYLFEFCTQIRKTGNYYDVKDGSKIVRKIRSSDLDTSMLNWADQVLCTTNATRKILNEEMRRLRGFTSEIPQVGDKMICLKNYDKVMDEGYTDSLFNGMIGYITQIYEVKDNAMNPYMDVEFRPDYDKNLVFNCRIDLGPFYGQAPFKNTWKGAPRCSFDFGYAITVHKSQGSEYEKVLVYFEPWGTDINKKRLAYTAATRAEKKLVWVV